MSNQNKSSVLIFSLATHGYEAVWDKCIDSHQKYALRNNYQYFCITHIPKGFINNQVVRSKLPLVAHALSHYDWVVFLDSDCLIQDICPPIESLEKKSKYVYFAPGFSGRINSGVIITRSNPKTIDLFNHITEHKNDPLPEEDNVSRHFGDNENGHVIHYCKNSPLVEMIDRKWNNNVDTSLKDYIRHYSGGGMRALYTMSLRGKITNFKIRIRRFFNKILTRLGIKKGNKNKENHSLNDLVHYCLQHYPLFHGSKSSQKEETAHSS